MSLFFLDLMFQLFIFLLYFLSFFILKYNLFFLLIIFLSLLWIQGSRCLYVSILCGMFLLIDFVRLFLNKFHISFTVLFASLFMFIIFSSVSSRSDLMLSQFALSYLRIFLGCWRTLRSHMSASM